MRTPLLVIGSRGAALPPQAAADGGVSWHLLRRQASSAILRLAAHRDVFVAIGELGHHGTGDAGLRPSPSGPAIPRRGWRGSCARPPVACSRTDRIWRDRRRRASCHRPCRRSRRARRQAEQRQPRRRAPRPRKKQSRSCDPGKPTILRLRKAAARVRIEALRWVARRKYSISAHDPYAKPLHTLPVGSSLKEGVRVFFQPDLIPLARKTR